MPRSRRPLCQLFQSTNPGVGTTFCCIASRRVRSVPVTCRSALAAGPGASARGAAGPVTCSSAAIAATDRFQRESSTLSRSSPQLRSFGYLNSLCVLFGSTTLGCKTNTLLYRSQSATQSASSRLCEGSPKRRAARALLTQASSSRAAPPQGAPGQRCRRCSL